MEKQIYAVLLSSLVACAIPRDQSTFSVAPTGGAGDPFISSQQLMVAGLVSESLGYGTKGRFFEAEARLRKAAYLEPTNSNIAFNLAVVLIQTGNTAEAVEILGRLRGEGWNLPQVLMALADAANIDGRREEARSLLKEAFNIYKAAGNVAQAALVSRSISNIAFAEGLEQEALCYSYEALSLAKTPQQFGYHAGLLVGLNLFREAQEFITKAIAAHSAVGASPVVRQAWALAKYGLGDRAGALAQVEIAQEVLANDPEIGVEVNVMWWMLTQDTPVETREESIVARLESVGPDVVRLQEKPVYRMLQWPAALRRELDQVRLAES